MLGRTADMKTSLAFISAFLVAVAAAADDDKCKNDFRSFLTCVKTQHQQQPASEKEAAKKERQDKANQCFASANCDPPNWDSSPFGGSKHLGGMQQMPEAVKQCLKRKMVEKFGAKLNDCLSKKGVKNVNFTALADDFQGSGLAEGHAEAGAGADKDGIKGALSAKFVAVKAVDKCAQKKGGDTNAVKPLEQCLHNIKKEERPKVCALIKPCEDKITGECKKRGQDVRKALCQCKKEKEKEISKKLQDLGHQQKKVGIQDLAKTVADDQDIQDVIQQVDNCYKEAGEQEPPLLKLALQMFRSGGNGGGGAASAKFGAAASVDGTSVVIMGDMMFIDADDQSECEPCL